jgi:hypothetical protein
MLERRLSIRLSLDERPVDSETRLVELGAYHVALSTVVLNADLPIEVHSSYLGHTGTETHATHLTIAPDIADTYLATHDASQLPVTHARERYVLDHLQVLIDLATKLDQALQVDLPDHAMIS